MMFAIGPDRDLLVRFKDRSDQFSWLHLSGYVVAVQVRPRVLHALDAETLADRVRDGSRRTTYDAVCGARVRLYGRDVPDGAQQTVTWPPRVSTLAEGVSRCSDCHEATGRRRPSAYFPAKAVSA